MLARGKATGDVDPAPHLHRRASESQGPSESGYRSEKELLRLQEEGIIEPVQFADWAAPIVPILKSDKQSVRICGDYKLTVNRACKLDSYPIPRVEDLFATLAGGKVFTKLDLSQAYQQLLLEEDSKKYVVINTQQGLFRYNRNSAHSNTSSWVVMNLIKGIVGRVVLSALKATIQGAICCMQHLACRGCASNIITPLVGFTQSQTQ